MAIRSRCATSRQRQNETDLFTPTAFATTEFVAIDPLAVPGGPYTVLYGGALALNGSGSIPSIGQSITTYEWDLNDDGGFDESVTGATPAAITYATLTAAPPTGHGMTEGANTIKLRVTDTAGKISTVEATVNLGGPMVIYEPFADSDATLGANTSGLGLSGVWTAQSSWAVDSGSIPWGALKFSGNQVRATTGGTGGSASISTGTTLTSSGLLEHGKTLWFSMLYTTTPSVSGNPDAGFALGTAALDGGNNIPMNSSGNGIGSHDQERCNSGQRHGRQARWQETPPERQPPTRNPSPARPPISWSVKSSGVRTEPQPTRSTCIFLTRTCALGPVVATRGAVLDQSSFGVISYAHKNDSTPSYFDEIRFGANYASVAPANTDPLTLEPSGFVDNKSGGPVLESDTLVYTVSFNKVVDPATIDATDFENGGTSPITFNNVTVSGTKAYVTVTPAFPGAAGTLQLGVRAGAVIQDYLGNALDTSSPISDDTLITVNADTVPPQVVSINSPPAATPIYGLPTIPFTVTFDKYFMDDATVTNADFTNLGTASITVGAVTRISSGTNPAVYSFNVTPTSTGTLQLRLSGTVQDLIGNAVAVPVVDDYTYTFANGESAKGNISLVNSAQGQDFGGTGLKTLAAGFDASGASKLVVVVGGEHGFSGNTGGKFYAMTYNGEPMTLVVQEEVGIPTAAIFYLDNPAAFSPGDIVVNQDNHNGSIFRAYALTGTAPGVGVSSKSTTNPSSIDLITAASNSWVIAGVLNAGPNGGNGGTNMSAILPLVENPLSDLESGSRWVSMCFATAEIATPVYGVYSFSGANATDLLATVGVEIPAAERIGGSAYTTWASTNAPTTGDDPSADEDGDGVSNGVEFVVGGTIATNDLDKLPTVATTRWRHDLQLRCAIRIPSTPRWW